jgi:dTDP-4-dehydrorhamnose reductase
MKVLIIGNKGMLGSDLQITFKEYEVVGWDKEDLDITDKEQVEKKITELNPDIVINAAAYNAVDAAEENEELANSVNGYAVGFLAKTCSKNNMLLVHYSTNYVFDGQNKNGYTEKDIPNPQSTYAASKALGEKEIQKNTHKFYLIRTSRIFGDQAKSTVAKKSFVDLMLDLASKPEVIRLVDEEYSNATYSKDIAQRTKDIIEWEKPNGIYHVTNADACTWYEFGKKIFEIKNLDVKIKPVSSSEFPRPAARPAYSVLINKKLPQLRTWEDALEEYLLVK